VAAAGNLKPILAAVFMAFSDIVVIGNSILLKIKKAN
jgi:cation transport ATPase